MKWLIIKSMTLIAQYLYLTGERELFLEFLIVRYKIKKQLDAKSNGNRKAPNLGGNKQQPVRSKNKTELVTKAEIVR